MALDFPVSTGITLHNEPYPFISATKFTSTLTGRIVLITGASRGIGRATALAFASAGASIAIMARTASSLSTLASEISEKYSTPVLPIVGDVLDDAVAIVSEVEEKLGKIDILVNNAGIEHMSRFATSPDISSWWRVMEVNVRGPISMIHAVLPSFIARKKGIVITVGSAAADLPLVFQSSYDASKAAVMKAIQILDMELRELGVLNFVVHPGSVKTGLNQGESVVGSDMRELMDGWGVYMNDTPELGAQSMVALAVLGGNEKGKGGDERIKMLSGRYWDAQDDLEEILEKAGEIGERNLYQLRIRKL